MQTKNPRRANLRVELMEDRTTPAVFTVNSALDLPFVLHADDKVNLTLRDAIDLANTTPGTDTIAFNILGGGARTITLAKNLPDVTQPTVLDATTQPGYAGKPLVELTGNAGATAGLRIFGGDSTVRGFVLNRFTSTQGPTGAIVLAGPGGNVVEGNYIGTNLAGTGIFANQRTSYGVIVRNDGNVIRDNVISGNHTGGILLQNVGQGDSANNLIADNMLGTDWTGTVDLGQVRYGVFFIGAGNGNRIEGNVISGNDEGGVLLDSDNNVVVGNKVGVAANGTTPLGNGLGVWISGGSNNTIGGVGSGEGNVIANNKTHGVIMTVAGNGSVPTGNTVRGNSIRGNGLLGIDLGANGVTPNDLGDLDDGPNNLQNTPVFTSASVVEIPGGGGVLLGFTLAIHGQPNATFTIDLYASAAADPSGNGEGERYLGSVTVMTDGQGLATGFFTMQLGAGAVKPGGILTATATDPAGNTSEFSDAVTVAALG